jgi:hypothetical protein
MAPVPVVFKALAAVPLALGHRPGESQGTVAAADPR